MTWMQFCGTAGLGFAVIVLGYLLYLVSVGLPF